jgi:hypothetical protein
MLGRPYALRIGVILGAPLSAIAARHLVSAEFQGMVSVWPKRPGFRCLGLGLAVSLAPMVAVLLVFRVRWSSPRDPSVLDLGWRSVFQPGFL